MTKLAIPYSAFVAQLSRLLQRTDPCLPSVNSGNQTGNQSVLSRDVPKRSHYSLRRDQRKARCLFMQWSDAAERKLARKRHACVCCWRCFSHPQDVQPDIRRCPRLPLAHFLQRVLVVRFRPDRTSTLTSWRCSFSVSPCIDSYCSYLPVTETLTLVTPQHFTSRIWCETISKHIASL